MRFKPYGTWFLLAVIIASSIFFHLFDASLFGVNQTTAEAFSFSAQDPLKNSLLPILSSPLLHSGLRHILMNAFFLLIFSFLIEKKYNWKILFSLILTVHVGTLLLLILLTHYSLLEAKNYLGLSHIAFGLISFWSTTHRKKVLFAFLLAYFILTSIPSGITPQIMSHLLGFLMGVVLGKLFLRRIALAQLNINHKSR